MTELWWTLVFLVSAYAILYTWLGYPLLLVFWGRVPRRKSQRADYAYRLPTVSLLIVAYNEQKTIARKLVNCLRLRYPRRLLEIVVATDGCTDATPAIVRSFAPRVRLLAFAERRGKVSVLNDAVPRCRGEIVVLSDAEELYDREAVRALVAAFSAGVGAVSGVVRFHHPDSAVGAGAGLYWRLEQFIRSQESRIHSMLGATGCIYALRRCLFRPVPPDSLSDDAVIPLDLISRGWRVRHQPVAVAYGEREGEGRAEFRRKARTTAGTWQFLWRQRGLLLPGSGVALQIFSHYFMRLASPVFLLAALVSAAVGAANSLGLALALGGQCLFYGFAVAGRWLERSRLRLRGLLLVPYYFCLAYAADIVGLISLALRRQKVAWQRS